MISSKKLKVDKKKKKLRGEGGFCFDVSVRRVYICASIKFICYEESYMDFV